MAETKVSSNEAQLDQAPLAEHPSAEALLDSSLILAIHRAREDKALSMHADKEIPRGKQGRIKPVWEKIVAGEKCPNAATIRHHCGGCC